MFTLFCLAGHLAAVGASKAFQTYQASSWGTAFVAFTAFEASDLLEAGRAGQSVTERSPYTFA